MENPEYDLPSVEDREDDIENEIPEHVLEWLEGWRDETIHPQLYELAMKMRAEWPTWLAFHKSLKQSA